MAETADLEREVARLRELVGPSEETYLELRLRALGLRDRVIGLEQELANARLSPRPAPVPSTRELSRARLRAIMPRPALDAGRWLLRRSRLFERFVDKLV